MATSEAFIRDSVISVTTSSDVTEMTLQQTDAHRGEVASAGGGGVSPQKEVAGNRRVKMRSFERNVRRCQAIKEK